MNELKNDTPKAFDIYGNMYDKQERKKIVAINLERLRKENGYTQTRIAELLGITKTAYFPYEKGTAEPSIEMLVRLSYLYNVPIDIIVGKEYLAKAPKKYNIMLNAFQTDCERIKKKLETEQPENADELMTVMTSLEAMIESIKELNNAEND